jgi:hypothetical protein
MDNVTRTAKFIAMLSNDNFLRLTCFGLVGIGMLVTMIILEARGVKWLDKENNKVHGHAFAFVATYLFLCFLFLGFIFDFVATAWVKMGEWILYGYVAIMGLFTTSNIAKTVSEFGLRKAEVLGKINSAMGNKPPTP